VLPMASYFPLSTASATNTPDLVAEIEEPTSSEATNKSSEPTELPASPRIVSPLKNADESPRKDQDMSTEKKDWISDEKHNGQTIKDVKHDPRAGSGIEFVAQQEEEEKQVHQATPENEESSPKYGVPRPESEGLEAFNRPVYINNDEEEGSNSGPPREESDWHFSIWECWKPGSLCTFPVCDARYIPIMTFANSKIRRHRIRLLPLRPSWPDAPTSP
jgi:hypothetical protein